MSDLAARFQSEMVEKVYRTMETLVLAPEYRALFTDEERATAARRLEEARATPAA